MIRDALFGHEGVNSNYEFSFLGELSIRKRGSGVKKAGKRGQGTHIGLPAGRQAFPSKERKEYVATGLEK